MIKILISIFVLSFTLNASEVDDLEKNFINTTNEVVSIVKNKNLLADTRNDKIVKTITPMFDFKLMAKLSLGKKWKTMDKQKQSDFINLYVKRMKKSYSSKVDKYTDEKIIVNKVKQIKKTRIVLNSSLVSNDDKTEVVYKFYKPRKAIENKNKWIVYDVVIAGVSIIKTDKAQFREVLKNNSIDILMDKIK